MIILLALVGLTLACVLSTTRTLRHLSQELRLLEERQQRHWNPPTATNGPAMTTDEAPAQPLDRPPPLTNPPAP